MIAPRLPASPSANGTFRLGVAGAFALSGITAQVMSLSGASFPIIAMSGGLVLLLCAAVVAFLLLRQTMASLAALDAEHFLWQQLTANYPNGVMLLYDRDVRFFVLEGQGALDLGFAREAVIGRTMGEIFPPEVWDPISNYYTGVFDGRSSTFELRFGDRIRHAHTQPIRDRQGNIITGMVVTYDITRQKQVEQSLREREEQLIHLALHDPLTNLANRTLLNNQLEHALKRARRTGHGVALLFLDLDNFKPVNDQFGHETGDQLLIQVGKRLRETVRAEDTVARFGGDEFVILLEEISSEEDVCTVAGKVLGAVDQPFDINGLPFEISTSLGYSFSLAGDVTEAGELIRRADVSMYRAKTHGKHQLASMDGRIANQMSLI